jgi:aspartate/methionine/tyrosine aminotransferase
MVDRPQDPKKMSRFTKPLQNISLPQRVQQFLEPSVWLEFSPLSSLCDAINLGQGFPDWKPPKFVTEAASKATSDPSWSQYARSSGLPSLVSTISKTYAPLLQR